MASLHSAIAMATTNGLPEMNSAVDTSLIASELRLGHAYKASFPKVDSTAPLVF